MTLADAILSLHPAARPGVDFVVAQSGDPIAGTLGPDEIASWNEAALGKRDDAAIAAAVAQPGPAPVRLATSYDLVSALTDDEVAALGKAKAKDQHLFGKRDTPFPEDNPKIARFAALLNTSPKAWFDRVFAPAA